MEKKAEGFSLKGFEKTLNPKTVKYITQKASKKENIDLRQLSEDVEYELKSLQNDAAFDYLKVENETYELLDEIKKSDNILEELEDVLKSFRDGLSQVKNEMTFLQERSVNMNVSLNNRKNLSKTFSNFIENVMLEPQLIDNIIKGPIDDEHVDVYVENIKKLCRKLEYIKKYNLLENLCVREIEPELSKLKLKACERIRNFVQSEFQSLQKPRTNIHLIQQNRLIKYRMFILFLRDHNQPIYFEIVEDYTKIMNKIYNDNLRTYINELNKLLLDTTNRKDMELAFPENLDVYKQNRFDILERSKIFENPNEQPIIAHVANNNKLKFNPEALFKSLNKLLVETAGQEYTFSQNFFSLNDEQTAVIFMGIFKQTVINVLNKVKVWIKNTMDPFSPLMIAILNSQAKTLFQEKGFDVLDFYFDQINFEAWPKSNNLYDQQINSLRSCNIQNLKLVGSNLPTPDFVSKVVKFTQGLYICASRSTENQMLKYRITRYIQSVATVFKNIATVLNDNSPRGQATYIFIKLDFILQDLTRSKSLGSNDAELLEQDIEAQIEIIVQEIMISHYGNLIKFVQKGSSSDSNPDAQNLTLIENISKEFCESWLKKLGNIRQECDKQFEGSSSINKVLKRVMNKILENYTNFFNIVKGSYPSYTSNMVPLHKLTIDIKKQINSLGDN